MRLTSRLTPLLLTGLLCGCGLADSYTTFVPEALRLPRPPQTQSEPPDVRAIVQADPTGLFLESAHPTNIKVSPPQPGIAGLTWTACVKADVTGMSGNLIANQLLIIEIADNKIRYRRRADPNGPCAYATYEPISPPQASSFSR